MQPGCDTVRHLVLMAVEEACCAIVGGLRYSSRLVTLTQNLGQKKGSVAISRSRILGKWESPGYIAALPLE